MFANDRSFPNNKVPSNIRLVARGFSNSGDQQGGLKSDFRIVEIPINTHIFRLHDGSSPFGAWWFSAWEGSRIVTHYEQMDASITKGRDSGRSLLHATFSLVSEWYSHRTDQLCRFTELNLEQPFIALYGEGDAVLRQRSDGSDVPVPAPKLDEQIGARQIFIPDLRFYREALAVVKLSGMTDFALVDRIKSLTPTPKEFEKIRQS